jgi:hypothetical protein
MMRVDFNFADGLVNGAVGRLARVDTAQHPKLHTISVKTFVGIRGQDVVQK